MTLRILLSFLALTLGPLPVLAAPQAGAGGGGEAKKPADAEPAAKPAAQSKRKGKKKRAAKFVPLMAVVRGFYVQAQWGGGYTVADSTIGTLTPEEQLVYPGLTADDRELLGAGARFGLAVGYDLLETVALQGVAGAVMIGGGREERVRDLALFYGGFGPQFGFELNERTFVVLSLAGLWMRASDGVRDPSVGFGGLVTAGVEYYVHVRHFSVGAELTAVIGPMSDMRTFVSVSPLTLKYTF